MRNELFSRITGDTRLWDVASRAFDDDIEFFRFVLFPTPRDRFCLEPGVPLGILYCFNKLSWVTDNKVFAQPTGGVSSVPDIPLPLWQALSKEKIRWDTIGSHFSRSDNQTIDQSTSVCSDSSTSVLAPHSTAKHLLPLLVTQNKGCFVWHDCQCNGRSCFDMWWIRSVYCSDHLSEAEWSCSPFCPNVALKQ